MVLGRMTDADRHAAGRSARSTSSSGRSAGARAARRSPPPRSTTPTAGSSRTAEHVWIAVDPAAFGGHAGRRLDPAPTPLRRMARMADLNDPITADPPWWRDAVVYQVYVRSFADSDGDGIGDLPGITSRLPYLRDLGVDALWITPFYPSPQHDHGYDVADYRDVDPLFGTLADADALIARAHDLGLRVIVDLVPNHTSDEHAWFQAALAAGPGSPERARYLFRDGAGRDGPPPNNWESVFGGPAWTRVEDPGPAAASGTSTSSTPPSPTSTGATPRSATCSRTCCASGSTAASTASASTSRTACSRRQSLRDQVVTEAGERRPPGGQHRHSMVSPRPQDEPMWDQPEVHDVYRRWHDVLDELRRRPDGRRRGLDPDAGVDGRATSARRARPGVQLRVAAAPTGRREAFAEVITAPCRGRAGRRLPDLGAEQPRRRPPPDPLRRRRRRAWPAPAPRR